MLIAEGSEVSSEVTELLQNEMGDKYTADSEVASDARAQGWLWSETASGRKSNQGIQKVPGMMLVLSDTPNPICLITWIVS